MRRPASAFLFASLVALGPGTVLTGQEAPLAEESPVDLETTSYELGGQWKLKDLMAVVSKATGKQFIYTESDLDGKIIQFTDNLKVVGPTRLYRLFELVIKGEGMITKNEMQNKVRLEKVNRKHRHEPWRVVEDQEDMLELKNSYQIVTRVEEILNGDPTKIASQLQQLLDPEIERVLGLQGTNVLIISAYAHNVERINRIIQIMDTKLDKMNVYTVPCKFALAKDLSGKINQILNHQAKSSPALNRGKPSLPPLVVADERTQNLVIVGLEEHRKAVEDLVVKLDINVAPPASRFKIFPVSNRMADELVALITNIYEGKKSLEEEAGLETAPRPNRPDGGGNQPAPNPPAPGGGNERGGELASSATGEVPRVVADLSTNSVIALSSSQRIFDELQELIFQLDVKQPQVFVEVTILEIGDNSERQLGFELLTLTNPSDGKIRPFGVTSFGNSTVNTVDPFGGRSPLISSGGSLQSGLVAGLFKDSADKIPILLRAIQNNSDSTLVAVPRILTTNNKEATFEIRSAIPTARTDTNNVATTTSFGGNEEAVTTLKITPSISLEPIRDSRGRVVKDANGVEMMRKFIRLQLEQDITRFVGESTDPALPPSQLQRKAVTEVTIPDEATVVIGGFTQFNDARAVDKIPYAIEVLEKIPLLGPHVLVPIFEPLLQRKTETRERTTLYMFVTPHIITDLDGLQGLRERLIDEEHIDNLMEEYDLISELEKTRRLEKKKKRDKRLSEANEDLLEDEQSQLRALQERWENEAEEIRARGEDANLDEDNIDWEVTTTRKCREDMYLLLRAVESWKVRTGRYPNADEGLGVLFKKTEDDLPPLLTVRMLDPWGGQYQYVIIDGNPVIRSYGANRAPGGLGIDKDLVMGLVN